MADLVVVARADLERIVEAACARALEASRPPPSERVGVAEAAAMLGCSTRHVRRIAALGRLTAVKLAAGGSSRLTFVRADVERLLQEGRV